MYTPESPPYHDAGLEWVQRELLKISRELVSKPHEIFHAEPRKPRVGVVAYADGTDWNPGDGEGLYEFRSDSQWYKLAGGITVIDPFTVVITNQDLNAAYFQSIEVDASSSLRLITLPSPSISGKDITVKKMDSSANIVRLVGTVDGEANFDLLDQDEVVTVRSNGTGWSIV